MEVSRSAGIDYGMGMSNIDKKTGIRFGVISSHDIQQAWCDSAEPVYPDPPTNCESCGRAYGEPEDDNSCEDCDGLDEAPFDDFSEPIGYELSNGEYKAVDCLDTDVMVLESPYYTRGVFCSPCVPGAVSLNSPCEDGAIAYCFGHDWFDNGKAPYHVYRVSDDSEVFPD